MIQLAILSNVQLYIGEKPYKCDTCEAAFARSDYLSHHMTTRHNGSAVCYDRHFAIRQILGYLFGLAR